MDIKKILDLVIEILVLINKGMEANKAISSISSKHGISETMIKKFLEF